MAKSKRSKVVSLTKTAKKTLANKKLLVEDIRKSIDQYKYVWLFTVGEMRNEGLQDVRKAWKGTGRIVYGKNKVVAKALGETVEVEYKEGLHEIAKRLKGPLGLFLTSWDIQETLDWFSTFTRPTYLRAASLSTAALSLPAGPIVNFEGTPFPHSMEPQLRACGLKTTLVRGVPSLMEETEVCKVGENLSSEKARLLALLGYMHGTFQVKLGSRWSEDEGFVEGDALEAGEEADADEDEAME